MAVLWIVHHQKNVLQPLISICVGGTEIKRLLVWAFIRTKTIRTWVFPDTVIAARIDEQKICLPYLAFAWKMPSVRNQIECSARTTNGTYKINQQSISNIRLILLPISLQKEFAAFVEELDKSKFSVSRQQKMIDSCLRGIILRLVGRL